MSLFPHGHKLFNRRYQLRRYQLRRHHLDRSQALTVPQVLFLRRNLPLTTSECLCILLPFRVVTSFTVEYLQVLQTFRRRRGATPVTRPILAWMFPLKV